jgi:SWI/SNF-related matrix-associated actin-dependent regulator of chromatin subfamily A member 5
MRLQVLDRLLVKLHARGHRVVLFSQFATMIDLLDDYCTLRGWNFVRLTGSTNRVQRMVNLQVGVGGVERGVCGRPSTPQA